MENNAPSLRQDYTVFKLNTIDNSIDVLENDEDPDGDYLNITSVANPSNGIAEILGNEIIYTPNTNYNGPDQFTYTISDGNGGTDIASVSITVTGVNDAPVASDDSATVTEDSSDNQIDVLANDVDIDGDDLDITGVNQPSHGTASYTASFVYYTPDADFSGTDQFTYTISDILPCHVSFPFVIIPQHLLVALVRRQSHPSSLRTISCPVFNSCCRII